MLTNRWWVVHPEHGITFFRRAKSHRYRAPQCNGDETIVRRLRDSLYPDHDVQLIPVVYVGHES